MRMRRSNVCSHENYFPYVRSRKTTFQPFIRFICVLRVRDETKKLETYTTKKKKTGVKKNIVIMFVARLVESSFRPILHHS